MKTIALLLLSLSLAAADLAWPLPKDTPAWAKELNACWEAAWGKGAPKTGTIAQAEASTAYYKRFDSAFVLWLPRANLVPLPESPENRDFNRTCKLISIGQKAGGYKNPDDMRRNDRWFLKYAESRKDPAVLTFLWLPENRAKFPQAVE